MIANATICTWLETELDVMLADSGGLGEMRPYGTMKTLADAVQRMIVTDARGAPRLVLHCSRPGPESLVRRGIARARMARAALGADLGRVVLMPTLEYEDDELELAAYPRCASLPESRIRWAMVRTRLTPRILAWLRAVTRRTVDVACPDEVDGLYRVPLGALADDARFSRRIRAAAATGLDRLERGQWTPRVTLAHNDFWKHNVLVPPRGSDVDTPHGIAVIDWPGCRMRGHPIYDLVRMTMSVRASWTSLRPELSSHCRLVGCSLEDAPGYVAAHLGCLGANLGCFPPDRYVWIGEACFDELAQA